MIIKSNEFKSSLIKAQKHFSVKSIFEKSKSIFIQSLNVLQSRFSKNILTIQSPRHIVATEIQSKCGPLELKGRTLLDKFADVMEKKQSSIIMQKEEVELVATSSNVTQRSRGNAKQVESDALLVPEPAGKKRVTIDQELSKLCANKQSKLIDGEHASATGKPMTKELSMALNNISDNNPPKPQRPVMFSAFDLQAVNLKKKSACTDKSSILPQTSLSSTIATSNVINSLESKGIQGEIKKPFSVADILNVKLRSQASPSSTIATSNQSNGLNSKSIQDNSKKPFSASEVLNVKLRPQAPLLSAAAASNQSNGLESKSSQINVKKPFSVNDILNVKLRSSSAVASSNQANNLESNNIQNNDKKPFNINDILNVKLRSRSTELSNSSKKPSVIKVATKRKTPISKILGSIHNSQMSMHSALKQALSKKFKAASRQSINNAEVESPHSQWE